MKYKIALSFLIIILSSCKDDNQKGSQKTKRRQKKGSHFSNINKVGFYDTPINTTAKKVLPLE
jgi:hypothetical protein